MSTEQPQPNTARARGERSGPQRPPGTVRRGAAIAVAIATLIIGGIIGYFAAGGPDAPTDLQVVTNLPAVTVTVPAEGR